MLQIEQLPFEVASFQKAQLSTQLGAINTFLASTYIIHNIKPKIRKDLSITHSTNFKSVITLSNPQSP